MEFMALAAKLISGLGLRRPAAAVFRAYARARPYRVRTLSGITYELDLSETIDREMYLRGWEPQTAEFLRRTVRAGDVVIEVGANVGAHTLLLADLVGPAGAVIAFEPTAWAQAKLAANMARNPRLRSRITVRPELVTNHELATPTLNIRASFPVVNWRSPGETVSAAPLSLDALSLQRLDMVKIDVDGYDYKVLQGATRLLAEFKPVVLIELCEYSLNAQGDSIRDIFTLLSTAGYGAFYEHGLPIRSVAEVLQSVGTSAHLNGVFRPLRGVAPTDSE
jgi:FkbM family methyltransferase